MANSTLRFEFDVDLKPVKHKKRPVPKRGFVLQQRLVLAYQIHDLLSQGKAQSLHQIGRWLGSCHARMSQIINLLNLAPMIQQEILLSDDPKIHQVTEFHIRDIAMEMDWLKQAAMWKILLTIFS
jgi:hypothetical protein